MCLAALATVSSPPVVITSAFITSLSCMFVPCLIYIVFYTDLRGMANQITTVRQNARRYDMLLLNAFAVHLQDNLAARRVERWLK